MALYRLVDHLNQYGYSSVLITSILWNQKEQHIHLALVVETFGDKYSIRPVGVGETWRRLMEKCLLRVAGPEAKAACGMNQLTGGMEAGIEGAIHAMRVL